MRLSGKLLFSGFNLNCLYIYFIGPTNAEAEDAADLETAEGLDHEATTGVTDIDRKCF